MPCESSDNWVIAADIAQIIAPVAAWAAVIYQAWRNSKDNREMEARRECRAYVDHTIAQIDEIAVLARQFHTSVPNSEDEITAFQLKRSIQHLGRRLQQLEKTSLDFLSTTEHVKFRRAVTLNDFDKSDRVQRPPTDVLVVEIEDSAMSLIEALDGAYAKTFLGKKG